jgi:hypothetical protein
VNTEGCTFIDNLRADPIKIEDNLRTKGEL